MENIKEPPFEENEIQLTKTSRLSIDKMNYTLMPRYRKREGKGKNASFTDEYAYGNNHNKYYSSINTLFSSLLKKEEREYMQVEITKSEEKNIEELLRITKESQEHLNKIRDELTELFSKNVTIIIEGKKRNPKAIHEVIEEVDVDE